MQTSIRGIEKKPLPHLLCTTNLILHDVEVPQVWHDNALTRRPYKDYDEADRVDVILTNPPFGGMEEPGVEQNFPQNFQTKETADLFLAMIVKLLKDGGKGADGADTFSCAVFRGCLAFSVAGRIGGPK